MRRAPYKSYSADPAPKESMFPKVAYRANKPKNDNQRGKTAAEQSANQVQKLLNLKGPQSANRKTRKMLLIISLLLLQIPRIVYNRKKGAVSMEKVKTHNQKLFKIIMINHLPSKIIQKALRHGSWRTCITGSWEQVDKRRGWTEEAMAFLLQMQGNWPQRAYAEATAPSAITQMKRKLLRRVTQFIGGDSSTNSRTNTTTTINAAPIINDYIPKSPNVFPIPDAAITKNRPTCSKITPNRSLTHLNNE